MDGKLKQLSRDLSSCPPRESLDSLEFESYQIIEAG